MSGLASKLAVLAAGLLLAFAGSAQQPTITPNYKDADIRQVIEAVSELSLIHISEPTRRTIPSRMPSSA